MKRYLKKLEPSGLLFVGVLLLVAMAGTRVPSVLPKTNTPVECPAY